MITFPALDAIPGLRAGFTRRVPGVDVSVPREVALSRLEGPHREARESSGLGGMVFATAEQIHGSEVKEIFSDSDLPVSGADGLVTVHRGICLGIYVADCAAVFLADRRARGIALVHSGKKGTEGNIAAHAVDALCRAASTGPADIVAQVSPCIRPPHYEVDFASKIVGQLSEAGVEDIHDCATCTASGASEWYSYRRERGLTGRMLAFIALL